VVEVRLELGLPHLGDLAVLAREHDRRVAVHGDLAGDRRAGDRAPGALVADVLGHLVRQGLRQDREVAVVVGLDALGERDDVHARLEQVGELLARPVDAEAVHTAHHVFGALERLLGLFELVSGHALGNLQLQVRVDARRLDGVDDLAVEERADEANLAAVVRPRSCQGGGHDAGAQDDQGAHLFGSFRWVTTSGRARTLRGWRGAMARRERGTPRIDAHRTLIPPPCSPRRPCSFTLVA
jgi:hypothetical protein